MTSSESYGNIVILINEDVVLFSEDDSKKGDKVFEKSEQSERNGSEA